MRNMLLTVWYYFITEATITLTNTTHNVLSGAEINESTSNRKTQKLISYILYF